ncbi:MAG TPA: phosphatidylserine decarboxylase [Bryobacteraceae bacterium]|nr:phosphatidylserine decarboxylase [Bryobacteraceae bacterium]
MIGREWFQMVVDGIWYGIGLTAAGLLMSYIVGIGYGIPLFILAAFCMYFFRDPDRPVPQGPVAVSPADGKVVLIQDVDPGYKRISIFLNIFDVHVNRSPVSGTIQEVEYHKGQFLVASKEAASSDNERNTLVVQTPEGFEVSFSQIAGLIARRIVCWKKAGDPVLTGERIGLIKFGSRVDVVFGPEWEIVVETGKRVSAGSSVLARLRQS